MNKILYAALAFSLAANAYLFLKLLDSGIMLDNSRSEVERQRARSELSLAIINRNWVGQSSNTISAISKELAEETGAIVGTEGGGIEVGDLVFESKDGVITEVHYID
ncbi:MAG: hypothetical protein ACREO8_07490 [Luteimonas sp.]